MVYEAINKGREFKDRMHEISVWLKETLKGVKVNPKKTKFRAELKNPQSNFCMLDLGPQGLASPLDPKIKCYGVEAD